MGKYIGPRSEQLGLVAPGLKYNTGYGLKMGLQVGAATAGSFHGLHVSMLLCHERISLNYDSVSLWIRALQSQRQLSGATALVLWSTSRLKITL
jgi:hypothetical protein